MRLDATILGAGLAIALAGAASAAGSRGLTVSLRASESKDAPVVETVELYARSHALVIGIDDYAGGWPRLSNAVKDAEAVATALEDHGFAVTLKRNLTSGELKTALEEFFVFKGADPEARLFVWFAGHGHTDGGEGFLVPKDAPRAASGAQFRYRALSLRRFGEFVRLAQSKHAFAVFDSCFAGTIFDTARSAPPPAITAATVQPVRQFLSSGDAGQEVSDNGRFRTLFIEALGGQRRADANGDGYLTASELGLFLSDSVTNYSKGRQTPRYGKLNDPGWDRGDFVFRLAAATPGPAATGDRETVFWQSIAASANPALFDAYLAQYPEGTFAALARLKRDELEAVKTASLAPPAFTVEARDETLVALQAANLREAPRAASAKVATLAAGAEVAVTGTTRAEGQDWYRVAVSGRTGFVFGPLLGRKPATPAVGVYPGPSPGTTFRDCADCPEMVAIPPGSFTMGSPDRERQWFVEQGGKQEWAKWETPSHGVEISRAFAVGKYEVTRGEFAAFARETGHDAGDSCWVYTGQKWESISGRNWRNPGFGQTDRDPVACVSWEDAKAYMAWLSRKTGKDYRLLSEAEWEYAARGGTGTMRHWGDDWSNEQGCAYANAADQSRASEHNLAQNSKNIFMCRDGATHTAPVGRYKANGFGLHDMLGNVWEWVEDCWHESYNGAPGDGGVWKSGGNCSLRVLRGGSWNNDPGFVRSADRYWSTASIRSNGFGFRVARTLSR